MVKIMEEKWNDRTKLLIGEEAVKKLEKAKVAVYGIGGVGSFAVEALTRAGIGHLVLIDNDYISISNLNRQIHSNTKTIGQKKAETMKQRILEINPNAIVEAYMPENNEIKGKAEVDIIDNSFDYIVDCVDTVTTKLKLIEKAEKENVRIISCMGTGNKLNPTMLEVADIFKTSVCPLAKVMRKELKKRNIKKLKVVYSKEEPKCVGNSAENGEESKTKTIGSISFVPSVAGLIIASEVIKDVIG